MTTLDLVEFGRVIRSTSPWPHLDDSALARLLANARLAGCERITIECLEAECARRQGLV